MTLTNGEMDTIHKANCQLLYYVYWSSLTIRVTWRVSSKKQELFTLRGHPGSLPGIYVGSVWQIVLVFCTVQI
jgi:hypothetical protein